MSFLPFNFLLFLSLFFLSTSFAYAVEVDPNFVEAEIRQRLEQMQSEVSKPRYDPAVMSYLRTYLINDREKSERILGRRILYFPLFEQELRNRHLPEELKYLAIVESALEPRAVSRAKAVGLWQFMEETGKYFGLTVNSVVDERCDPEASTKAAVDYLELLYDRFGDWELAIAAYNSGGGRVSRAMKRARSTNFWRVRDYLPQETRSYVPAFIAVSYLMAYHELHNLQPNYPSLDEQLTETLSVNRDISFMEIARVTGVSLETLSLLNPSYQQQYIPENPYGHKLVLPRRVSDVMKAYLELEHPDPAAPYAPIIDAPVYVSQPKEKLNANYVRGEYIVQVNETLESLAETFNCSTHQLIAWNRLTPPVVAPGQKIIVYHNKGFEPTGRMEVLESFPMLPIRSLPSKVNSKYNIWEKEIKRFLWQDKYLYYWTKKRESVFDIAEKLPGISATDIIRLNKYKGNEMLKADTKVKIKVLSSKHSIY